MQLPKNTRKRTVPYVIEGFKRDDGKTIRYRETKSVVFQATNEPKELEHIYHTRYDIFCTELHAFDQDAYQDNLEHDDYDNEACHLTLYIDGELAAYSRLIGCAIGYPMEKSVSLPMIFNRDTSFEGSRALVTAKWRGTNVAWIMFSELFAFCKIHGVDTMPCFSNSPMYNGYKKRGVLFRYEGEPVQAYGYKTYPLVIDIAQSDVSLFT